MAELNRIDLKFTRDDKFIILSILDTIDINTLKNILFNQLGEKHINIIDNLIHDDGVFLDRQEIIIHVDSNIVEQYVNKRFTYFYLDNKELLINKIDHSYFYLEDGDFYLSKEMTIEEKEEVIPRVCSVLKFLKTFHDKDKNKIDLLYYDIDIVNYDRVKVVIDDDILELVIPDFYEVSLVWMKMAVVLKKTREVIGSIEFNFNQDESNFYDYKGNVSYEIKREYQKVGYATKALTLLRRYLRDNGKDNDIYISTESNNESSQRVALKNDGILCYEGTVPKSSVLNFLGKVDKVKIYRIENM